MEQNVLDFVNECSGILGANEEQSFFSKIEFFEIEGCGAGAITSPIEQILYAALIFGLRTNHIPEVDPVVIGDFIFLDGILIKPQFPIEKYFIDFLIVHEKRVYSKKESKTIVDESKSILIECDSQMWHERTEKERRYEKKRDRAISKQGDKVFHYTGKEIIENPNKIALEILTEIKVL